jgi:hypothetical protein
VELKDINMFWKLRYNIRIWKINFTNWLLTMLPNKILFLIFTRIAAVAMWNNPTKEFGSITVQEITESLVGK